MSLCCHAEYQYKCKYLCRMLLEYSSTIMLNVNANTNVYTKCCLNVILPLCWMPMRMQMPTQNAAWMPLCCHAECQCECECLRRIRLVNGSGRVGLGPNPTPTRPRLGLEFGKPTWPDYPPGYPVGYSFNLS